MFIIGNKLSNVYTAFESQSCEPKIIEFFNTNWDIHKGGHLQGIQRIDIDDVPHFVITGSSEDEAYFIIVRNRSGRYEIIRKEVIGKNPYRHAGGLQIIDNFLAVGVEDNEKQDISQVLLFNLKGLDITNPITRIQRKGEKRRTTAGAVALTKLKNEYLLIVGSWDSDTLDFYVSSENSLYEFKHWLTWDKDKSNRYNWSDREWGNYQNLNLVNDINDNLFLIGYYFDEEKKSDYVDLFSLHLDNYLPDIIKKESRKQMFCRNGASFNFCGGCFIKDENTIISYACSSDCTEYGVINEFS